MILCQNPSCVLILKTSKSIIFMKKKKDCKECGSPLKDWQVKQDYDLCLECYNEKKKKAAQ